MTHLEIVTNYITYRKAENYDSLLACLSDNIEINSVGTIHSGKDEVLKYFEANKAEGEWNPPETSDMGDITVDGKVYKYFMWWNVQAIFQFDSNDKIQKITIIKK